jgi:hypothetical protein
MVCYFFVNQFMNDATAVWLLGIRTNPLENEILTHGGSTLSRESFSQLTILHNMLYGLFESLRMIRVEQK